MTPIKRRLLYIFRDTLLRLRITWNHGTTLTLSVGYHVDRTDSRNRPKWDGTRCRINTSHGPDKIPASVINRALEILEDKVAKAFYSFESADTIPTPQQLKNAIADDGKPVRKPLTGMIREFIEEQSTINQWSLGMLRNCNLALMYLVEVYGDDTSLDSIDETAYARLLKFFFSKKTVNGAPGQLSKVSSGLSNRTINTALNHIKRFATWARKKGYCSGTALVTSVHSLKTIKKPVIFLEWGELVKLMNVSLDFLDNYAQVRDAFLFGCFTGLRYSDIRSLKWSMVKDNDRLEVATRKTADLISINLNKFSRNILDKYRGREGDDGLVFRLPSLVSFNIQIAKIAREAGIDSPVEIPALYGSEKRVETLKKWECVTSHTARRTFVCNSISLGIPPDVIMKWTGHTDYKSMKPYIDVMSRTKKENMALYDTLPDLPNLAPASSAHTAAPASSAAGTASSAPSAKPAGTAGTATDKTAGTASSAGTAGTANLPDTPQKCAGNSSASPQLPHPQTPLSYGF